MDIVKYHMLSHGKRDAKFSLRDRKNCQYLYKVMWLYQFMGDSYGNISVKSINGITEVAIKFRKTLFSQEKRVSTFVHNYTYMWSFILYFHR